MKKPRSIADMLIQDSKKYAKGIDAMLEDREKPLSKREINALEDAKAAIDSAFWHLT